MLAHHETTNPAPRSPLPFETEHFDILTLLDQAGVPYRSTGASEIEADVLGTGHFSCKINTVKGLWLMTDGSGRAGGPWGLRKLLKERGLGTADEPRVWIPRVRDPEEVLREWQGLVEKTITKIRLARAIWDRAHVPHEQDLRPGRKWHKEVKAACQYFSARGFDGEAVVLSGDIGVLRIARPDPQYDAVYIEAGCVAVIVWPMYTDAGALTGIQRLYIDSTGQKVGTEKTPARKMLGAKGTTKIYPTREPELTNVGLACGETAVGEGFESTLALCEATGRDGIVCWDAGHLVAWAEQEAERWSGSNPLARPLGPKPAYLVAVDRDKSETGQKAAARVCDALQEAGITALFMLPPGDVKGGEKGADWNDVLREKGFENTGLAAVLSRAQAGDALALAPRPKKRGEVHELWPARDAEVSEAWEAVEGLDVDKAREKLAQKVRSWLVGSATWVRSREYRQRVTAGQATLGIKVSTGVGKSTLLRQLIPYMHKLGVPVVIVTQDRTAAEEYEEAGAFWRHGRQDMSPGENGCLPVKLHGKWVQSTDPWVFPWHCPYANDKVPKLAMKEHTIASEMCHVGHCLHGVKRALEEAWGKGEEPSSAVARCYAENKEAVDACHACVWLDHHVDAMKRLVIVVTEQGFGSGDAVRLEKEGDKVVERRRVVIVDESVSWGHLQTIGLDEISVYLRRIEALKPGAKLDVEEAERELAVCTDKKDTKDCKEKLKKARKKADALEVGGWILAQCARLAGEQAYTGGALEEAKADLVEAGKRLGAVMKDVNKGKAAEWERPAWQYWTELVETPLRAAREIARAAERGVLAVQDGKVTVGYGHMAVEEALGETPVLIMDATMPMLAQSLVKAVGGEIMDVTCKQNIEVIVDPRWFHKAIGDKEKDRLELEAELIIRTMDWLRRPEYKLVAIMQKRKAIAVLKKLMAGGEEKATLSQALDDAEHGHKSALWELTIEKGIGWWGWHERAHDEWGGCDIMIWDDDGIPRTAMRDMWEVNRLFLAVKDEKAKELPHYPKVDDNTGFETDVWVRVGDKEQQSRCRLPKDPGIRAFELAYHSENIEQAIGRVRPVNHEGEPLRAYVLGGRPHPGLAEMGARSVRFEKVIDLETRMERGARVHDERLRDAVLTGLALEYQGKRGTQRAIQVASRYPAMWRDCLLPPLKETLYDGGSMEESLCQGPGVRSDTAMEGARIVKAITAKLGITQVTKKDKRGGWDDEVADTMAALLDREGVSIMGGVGPKVIQTIKDISLEWPIYAERWDDDRHALVPNPRHLAGRRLVGAIMQQAKALAAEAGDAPNLWYTEERLRQAIEDVLSMDPADPRSAGHVPEDVVEAVKKWLELIIRRTKLLVWDLKRPHRRRWRPVR